MLYLTTRNKHDAYTAARTLASDRGPDGGHYLPYRMIRLDRHQVMALKDKNFCQCVAEILNQFFACRLSGWDVEFSIGRYPAKMVEMNHRLVIGEIWHNDRSDYAAMESALAERIYGGKPEGDIAAWVKIAIRIAVLTGVFGELLKKDLTDPEHPIDVAVSAGDFSAPMAVWYARQMGLPIANIICGCNENSCVWDLLHLGTMRTDNVVIKTTTPEGDWSVPEHLERLICGCLGPDEALRYSEICRKGGTYALLPADAQKVREGMFAAVVSMDRLDAAIPSLYRTSSYIMGPYTALGYGALLDYRAKTSQTRPALLLADKSPRCHLVQVSDAMNMLEEDLEDKL